MESGDDTDSDTGVEYYFRPELIGHYTSNYPTYVSLLPAGREQSPAGHTLCMLCLQTMTVEQCSSHPEEVKSFCAHCWSTENGQCRQLLDPRPAHPATNCTQPAPSPNRRMGSNQLGRAFNTRAHSPHADSDLKAWSDWLEFCGQLSRPIFPSAASSNGAAATRAQILAFVAYTTAQLAVSSGVALARVQAVGRQLELRDRPNPCFDACPQPSAARIDAGITGGFGLLGNLLPKGCSSLRCFAPAGLRDAARAHCSGLLASTECQSIGSDSEPASTRALLDIQSRSQPAGVDSLARFEYIGSESVSASCRATQGIQSRNRSAGIDFVPYAWPISGRMGSNTQASEGEMVTDLAVRYLQHAVPYTAGSSDICNADEAVEVDAHDYMNDALNEVSFEDLGDAAISNISDHLHMMADSEAFYSDSAELEVAHAVDELAQSCQALMLQRAMMAMWACISMLLLTSSHVALSVRNALSDSMQAGATWLTGKIFRLWHKPIISSYCPSMTCNSQQYNAQALDFYGTDSHRYPTEQQPAVLTLGAIGSVGIRRWL